MFISVTFIMCFFINCEQGQGRQLFICFPFCLFSVFPFVLCSYFFIAYCLMFTIGYLGAKLLFSLVE